MKAKRELKRMSSKFIDYCNKYDCNISTIKADVKNGKAKIYRYHTPNVYGDMYVIHGDKHCTIPRKTRKK